MVEEPLLGKIRFGQVCKQSAKFLERSVNRSGVLRRGFDPDVQVFRIARLGVRHHGVPANHEEVLAAGEAAKPKFSALLKGVLAHM